MAKLYYQKREDGQPKKRYLPVTRFYRYGFYLSMAAHAYFGILHLIKTGVIKWPIL